MARTRNAKVALAAALKKKKNAKEALAAAKKNKKNVNVALAAATKNDNVALAAASELPREEEDENEHMEPEGEETREEEDSGEEDGGEEEIAEEKDEDNIPMQPSGFFFSSNEFAKHTKMQTRCDPYKVIDVLRTRLSAKELEWFTDHEQFKHIFHMTCHRTRKVMGLWMLLLHTVRTEKRREVWFVVNGVPIRYSIREHALLSGLNCHMYPNKHKKIGSLNFVNKYFEVGRHKGPKIEVKDVLQALEKMTSAAGQDRLKMALLYFLSTVIRGRKKMHGGHIEDFLLRIVDDLNACKTYPWGRLTFDDNMSSIRDMMNHMGGSARETTTFPGFILPLEILAFECIPALRLKFRESLGDADGECPRMCKGRYKDSHNTGFGLDEIYDALGSTKDITSIISAEGDEEDLVARLVEDGEEDVDVHDATVNSWIAALTKPGGICFDELYESDVQSRLPQQVVMRTVNPSDAPESSRCGS